MQPLADWSLQDRRQISGIFTDIDDTLTTDGVITPDALQALSDLKAAGLQVIPVTGRPVDWCARFALGDPALGIAPWLVDAQLAENGALAFAPEILDKNGLQPLLNKRKQLLKIYRQSEATRASNSARMCQMAQRVRHEMPQVEQAILQAQAR